MQDGSVTVERRKRGPDVWCFKVARGRTRRPKNTSPHRSWNRWTVHSTN